MGTSLAILAGALVAGGIYLLLSQHLVRMLFGLVLLSNAVNLVIFAAGGLEHSAPPLIGSGQSLLSQPAANALPQALILTAIVIGFALLTFMFVLFYRSYQAMGTADTRKMRLAEPPSDVPAGQGGPDK
jgi:multicomponent Na+:H+ antiporter subunit C